jgi:DNA polymerase (family 10)
MELKGENPFKVRAFEKAARNLSGRTDLPERARAGTLTDIEGVGKGISEVLIEYFRTGHSKIRDELASSLPAGLLELTSIPGLGPKKAMALIEELEIHSVSELEYACKENRLLKLPGFGVKLQHKILEGIQFQKGNQGRQRLVDALPIAERVLEEIQGLVKGDVVVTGALRRRAEILGELEFLVEDEKSPKLKPKPKPEHKNDKLSDKLSEKISKTGKVGALPVKIHYADRDSFGYELVRTTASEESWNALGAPKAFKAETEEDFYKHLKIPPIPAESLEGAEVVAMAKKGALKHLLPLNGIRGIFHNHTTRSDGTATLEEMVAQAQKLGYEYIGISDHSQSAFYAQGLKKDDLLEQEKEIRKVQEKFPDIRVFWGIESDILVDGSLDYDAKMLKKFDFVIASIHSRFGMDRETMTQRVLEAVRNPCTRFLGHLTGRLLLGRKGYDLDMEKIIEEAARHDVAIELNANPARLDIDWRWGAELRKNGTKISVNPDAHAIEEISNTEFGVWMARKALMPTELVINSRSAKEVEKWLKRS